VRTEHEAQLSLLCIFTHMWQNFQHGVWSVTPLWLFVSSTSNIITLLWCKPSKVRDKVKAYIPSLVQRGRSDTATLIPDLGYRQWGEWSHLTQPIYPNKETRYSMWRRLDGPHGQHEWEWWRESIAPLGFEPPSVIPTTLCRLLKPSKV